jgi:hypothetical protein
MQIEKKLILCSILAISIGIAAIIPLEYLMNAETAAATPNVEPWFNVNVPYAYINLDKSGANDTSSWNGVNIQGTANFTVTPVGSDLQGADAKIEYYQFQVSSEQGPIVNISYSIALGIEKFPAGDKINNIPGLPDGGYMAITGLGGNSFTFANGVTYNGIPDYNGYCSGATGLCAIVGDNLTAGTTNMTYTNAGFGAYIMNYNGDNSNQVITQLRNAKSLYIDVSRICSVVYDGNVTVSTSSTNQVLQHIELTKTGNGWVYGTYAQGTVPFPIEAPSDTPAPSGLSSDTFLNTTKTP